MCESQPVGAGSMSACHKDSERLRLSVAHPLRSWSPLGAGVGNAVGQQAEGLETQRFGNQLDNDGCHLLCSVAAFPGAFHRYRPRFALHVEDLYGVSTASKQFFETNSGTRSPTHEELSLTVHRTIPRGDRDLAIHNAAARIDCTCRAGTSKNSDLYILAQLISVLIVLRMASLFCVGVCCVGTCLSTPSCCNYRRTANMRPPRLWRRAADGAPLSPGWGPSAQSAGLPTRWDQLWKEEAFI